MKLTLLVASFCLLNFINFVKCQSGLKPHVKNVEKFTDIITKTVEVIKNSLDNEFFQKAKEVSKEFFKQIENFSKVLKLAMLLINAFDTTSTETEVDKLKNFIEEQFAIVNGKLELIEDKLDHINVVFQDELAKSKFRDYLQMRDRIRDMINSFNANPNNITTIQLKETCADNNMRYFMVFLNGQVMDGGEGSLLEAMKRGHFKRTFMEWSMNIYGMFVEANVLYNQCFTVTYFNNYNEEEFTTTLSADNAKFEEMLRKITEKLEYEHNEFLKPANYMKWVESELRENMKRHRGMDHGEFAILMRNYFADKYYWRLWMVMSYDGDTATSDQHLHTISQYSIEIFREENRCVVLISMKHYTDDTERIERSQNWLNEVKNFVLWQGPHAFISHEKCRNIYEIIGKKFPNAAVHCVRADKHMEFASSYRTPYTSFSVMTFDDDEKTRTFQSKAECDRYAYYFKSEGYPGFRSLIPVGCSGQSMEIVVTNFFDF